MEWGAGGIFYHDDLVPKGAGWKLTSAATDDPTPAWKRKSTPQKQWLKLVRPTDMDVDASGRLYLTSWEGATFKYNGPSAGYVLRVTKKDLKPAPVLDFAKAGNDQLLQALLSDSAVLRLAAQREFLRRATDAPKAGEIGQVLGRALAPNGKAPLEGRIAALFTAAGLAHQLHLPGPAAPLALLGDAALRRPVLLALGDPAAGQDVPASAITPALTDAEPRTRAAAITALRRLGKADAAPAILPLVADSDPLVAHLAFRALRDLKAIQPCLGALDSSDDKVKAGALKALYGMYDPAVVEGLIQRLPGAKGELRRGLLNALCRLANQDAPYESPTVWWGTRPDTSGPVYQPIAWSETGKITAALKTALDTATGDDSKVLVERMYACKINLPGLVELMLAKAGNDTPAKLTAIEGLIRADNSLPTAAIASLQGITHDAAQAPELRARALRLFQKGSENGEVFAGAVGAFAPLAGHDLGDAKLTAAFEDFTRDAKNSKWIGDYAKFLSGSDAPKRQLAAVVLVNLTTSTVGKPQTREAAKKAVDSGLAKPESAAALLTAIARTGAKPLAAEVKANLNNPNNAVAEAALFAFQKLGLSDAAGAKAKTIGEMKYEEIFAAVQKGGEAKAGQEMFLRAGCIACHTISPDEPPKGPILSAVAKIYDRATLTESILKPNAKIAQGFESTFFKTKKAKPGELVEGFVTREGGDSVDVRNIAGQTVTIEKSDIAERGTRPQSMMPEGLLNSFTPAELANLLTWLESLKK